MKLHKDGTLEGTPQEIAEYNRLTKEPFPPLWNDPYRPNGTGTPLMPNPLQPTITCGTTLNAKVRVEGYKKHELNIDD